MNKLKPYAMKFISTKTHGVLDYLMGFLLIALPFILDIRTDLSEGMVLIVLGAAMVLLAVLTKYEAGIIKVIPMRVHLVIDIMSGVVLAASPWLFGFADRAYMLYVFLGLFEIIAAIVSESKVRRE